jgi:hypothetical protein
MADRDSHMIEPNSVRLTLFLPPRLHALVLQAAEQEFCRPSQFIRRHIAKALLAERPRFEDHPDED